MKRPVLIFAALAFAAALAFTICHRMASRPLRAGDIPSELAWLRAEFQLDDATFAKARALHAEYEPRCMESCARIERVNARIHALATTDGTQSEEMDAALRDAAELQRECRGQMWRHIESVAALFPPEQAGRYRQLMARAIILPGQPYRPAHAH